MEDEETYEQAWDLLAMELEEAAARAELTILPPGEVPRKDGVCLEMVSPDRSGYSEEVPVYRILLRSSAKPAPGLPNILVGIWWRDESDPEQAGEVVAYARPNLIGKERGLISSVSGVTWVVDDAEGEAILWWRLVPQRYMDQVAQRIGHDPGPGDAIDVVSLADIIHILSADEDDLAGEAVVLDGEDELSVHWREFWGLPRREQ